MYSLTLLSYSCNAESFAADELSSDARASVSDFSFPSFSVRLELSASFFGEGSEANGGASAGDALFLGAGEGFA